MDKVWAKLNFDLCRRFLWFLLKVSLKVCASSKKKKNLFKKTALRKISRNEFIPNSDLQQQVKAISTEFKLEFQSSIHQRNEKHAHSKTMSKNYIMWSRD